MKIIDNSSPITFGTRKEGECFKTLYDAPGEVYMKIPLFYDVNAILLPTCEMRYFDDDDVIMPVKATVKVENY